MRSFVLFAITIGIFGNSIFAQKLVKGAIKDENGITILGISGVSVSVKGSDKKVVTDATSTYQIMAKSGDTLMFSMYGYPSRELIVSDLDELNLIIPNQSTKNKTESYLKNYKGIKKAVFILVDGIATDMFYKANTPFIDAISNDGFFAEAYVGGKRGGFSETPTISAVGYNSMLTGTWVNKHNVFGNSIVAPNYYYPTIFRLFKNTYPNKQIAVFSTWLDNRIKLLGENLPQTNYLKLDYHFDGLELDEVEYPHDKEKKYLKRIDGEVAREAANYIYKNGPDLSWVYLEHSDDMGHLYGESSQFYEAVSYEDALIGMIWDAVKLREKETGENWLVIVTTDHGRRPIDGKHHGNQTYRERSTWVAVNKPINNLYAKNNKVAIVDILPTIADFMDISIPKTTAYEIDGVSMIKKVDVFDLEGVCINKTLYLKWLTEYQTKEKVTVYVSYTNNKKTGGEDKYLPIGNTTTNKKEFIKKIHPPKNTKYIKVVVETPNTITNTWIKNK